MNCKDCCYNLPKDSHSYCTYEDGECVKISVLEKENAELKGIKDVATLIRANNDTVVTLMQLNNKLVSKSQQLTKAKEIIKYLLSFIQKENYKTRWDINVAEAGQFLSEVEK